jgi:hypothetical protein
MFKDLKQLGFLSRARIGMSCALVGAFALALFIFASDAARATAEGNGLAIKGGATTVVTGGTGAPSFVPVITRLGFHFQNGNGRFDCLALAASAAAGTPGSGNFDKNVMYVTGDITDAKVTGSGATITGTANVTGLGAGLNVPFTATAERGGPGTRFVLTISGLTFDETVLEGEIDF